LDQPRPRIAPPLDAKDATPDSKLGRHLVALAGPPCTGAVGVGLIALGT